MKYNIEAFSKQMPILRDFLLHYVSYKELWALNQGTIQPLRFKRHLTLCYFMMSG